MTARELYKSGQLTEAVAASLAEVKQKPQDAGARSFLCELLCFSGDLERADKQLDAIGQLSPEAMVGVALLRQLIRAETARRQFFQEGRIPEIVDKPSAWVQKHFEASIRLREGDAAGGAALLAEAESMRPRVGGVCDGKPFEDWRDLDDLIGASFEVLTSNGKYYWIPLETVEFLEFKPIERPIDLLWRRVHMIVRGGPDGEVYLPMIYAGTYQQPSDPLLLGRATEWTGEEGAMRGLGLRTVLIGDEDRTLLEIGTVEFGSDENS
jgi:type VI secretion system protein ImpE